MTATVPVRIASAPFSTAAFSSSTVKVAFGNGVAQIFGNSQHGITGNAVQNSSVNGLVMISSPLIRIKLDAPVSWSSPFGQNNTWFAHIRLWLSTPKAWRKRSCRHISLTHMWRATDMFGFHQDFNGRTGFEIVANRRSQNVQQGCFGRRTGFTDHRVGTDQSRTQVQSGRRVRDFLGGTFDQFDQSIQISFRFRDAAGAEYLRFAAYARCWRSGGTSRFYRLPDGMPSNLQNIRCRNASMCAGGEVSGLWKIAILPVAIYLHDKR